MNTTTTNTKEGSVLPTINTTFTYKNNIYTVVEVGVLSLTARREGALYNTVFDGTSIPVDPEGSNTITKLTHPHFFKK
jgi:hypothetical protein